MQKDMLNTNDPAYRGKSSKVDYYGWKLQDDQGELRMVKKNDLRIDYTYQRNSNENKLNSIARDWSYIACGAITVADREGALYVVDGQHRVMAALKRTDISVLPCIVFKTTDAKQEAKGFLTAQTKRKAVTAIEQFRALVIIEDKAALIVHKLITNAGLSLNERKGVKSLRCVAILLKHANTDPSTLCEIWPLIVLVAAGQTIQKCLVEGLMYIAKRMPQGSSLMDNYWQKRVLKVGLTGLLYGATKASAYYVDGGSKVWALGMLDAINRGHRNRLELDQQ